MFTTLDTRPDETSSKRRWLVLAVMSVGTLIVFIDNTVVNTALPAISVDLGASISTLQWVVDSYVLVLAGLLLLGGSLGDRFGRKKWMTVGLVIFGLGSVGAALSTTAGGLIGFRGVQGLGASLVLPATLSIITNVFPRGERAKAIGIWTAVGGLGIGIGPVLGGWLVDNIGWSSVFWLHIPVLAIALIGMIFVPESRDERNLGLDLPGALLSMTGLIALVYGIIQGPEAGWSSPEIIAAFGLAVTLLTAFAIVEAKSDAPMLPLKFFRQKDFTGAVVTLGLIIFGMLVTFFFLTQYFQIVQGRSAFEAGLLIIPASVGMMLGAPLSGALVKKIGPRYLVLAMAGAMITGVMLLTRVEVDSSTLSVIIPLGIFGFGAGLGMPALTDTVMAAVPEADAGVGSAVNDVSRELGGALGIATIGSFVSSFYRSNVSDALAGTVPDEIVELAGESIGVATVAAANLPEELGATVVSAANQAFIDAMSTGFRISAAVLAIAIVIAFTLIPQHMRAEQANREPAVDHSGEAISEPAVA
ncbi:MAG: MFS transporter [Acidobacteria bacterium]|nr:MFS transporter [Acidobacteriota bacterium]